MGTPASSTDFVSLIAQSNLLDAATLDNYLKSHADSVSQDDPTAVAGALVRDGLLTHYQANQLLQGKWKGFFIGRYKVLGVLGAGGMGKVFLCEHPGMKRQVAIKVLPPKMAADPGTIDGFYREAQALASLDHRNIVHAFDAANDGPIHYLVMEYVKGNTLEKIVATEGPLSAHRAIDYLRQATLGLQHAFEAGLVHRDIKPSNFLVTDHGIVKILDLGLARFFHGQDSGVGSAVGEVVGTVDYMSPEQGLNSAEVDIRGDIYSLGATFYYCLTGHAPFEGGHTAQKLLWHQMREPAPIQNIRGDVPQQVIDIVRRMMAKDPAQRFQTPAELLLALPSQDILSEAQPRQEEAAIDTGLNLDVDSPTVTINRPAKTPQAPRWRPTVGLVAGLSVVLAIAAVGYYFVASQSGKDRDSDNPAAAPNGKPGTSTQGTPVVRKVWLCDLPEQDPVVGHGQFGKRGQTGYDNQKITVKGVASPHGLSMHPAANTEAKVRYELKGLATQLTGSVSINDSGKNQTQTPLIFVVKGDGKVRWESKPVKSQQDAQDFSADINGVYRLELEVRCPGSNAMAHAVWLEPQLTVK